MNGTVVFCLNCRQVAELSLFDWRAQEMGGELPPFCKQLYEVGTLGRCGNVEPFFESLASFFPPGCTRISAWGPRTF